MALDFMSDALMCGRRFRTFNVVDDFNREVLAIDVDLSLPAQRVIRVLERIVAWRGLPAKLRMDNGPEFISHEFVRWATEQGIRIEYIQPGKPQQNAYIERYNRTIRYSWLSKHLFDTLEEVQDYATSWLWHYNYERPHQANKGRPPLMAA